MVALDVEEESAGCGEGLDEVSAVVDGGSFPLSHEAGQGEDEWAQDLVAW